jgi:predicted DNA-binding transcriptional regulator AlpA
MLNRKELAKILLMTPNAIGAALCRGTFPIKPIRIGKRTRWKSSDVLRYLESPESKLGLSKKKDNLENDLQFAALSILGKGTKR